MEELPPDKDKQPGEAPDINPEFLARSENALMELSRSLKAVNFYPRGHPTLETALKKTQSALIQVLYGVKQFGFSISKEGFTCQSRPIAPNNANLPPLANELYRRQIKKIFFLPDVTSQEIEDFLRVIAMEEDLFRGKGKAEEYLADNDVEHIWANEIKFEQARSMPKKEESVAEGVDLDERIKQLIQSLRTEKDPRKFLAHSRETCVTALRFIGEENFDPAFLILKVFWEVMNEDPPRAVLITEGARSAFSELTTADMMEYLLRQLTLLHGPRQEEVLEVAMALEDRLVETILDKLATNEALYSHRALIQVLLQMPKISRELIEARLGDDNWFITRKMAFLLGEIEHHKSVKPLTQASAHSDPRVAKEALKSLSKIKTVDSTRHLVGLLTTKTTREIRAHIMRLLGAAREVSAVPTLVKFLKKRRRDILVPLDDHEMYTEAVRTLGQIGSQQAVPILKEILFKRSLLARARSLSLSIEAAQALGNIGGNAALEALKKGAENKNRNFQAACRHACGVTMGSLDTSSAESRPESAETIESTPKAEEK